jgi:phosphoribosylformylglycinamidine cyclo-ligase
MTMVAKETSYAAAGVDTDKEVIAVHKMAELLVRTHGFRPKNRPLLGMDFFANVIDLGGGVGLALSTDGVGSKVLIAQLLNKYDTIGIDCVATNVNDILCVGAEPIALLDYIGIQQHPDETIFGEIAKGLYAGAKLASISVPGGETAQLPDIIRGEPGGYALDLVGTCVGLVPTDRIVTGDRLEDGDALIGLRSSGIHSNGLTLARRVLFDACKWNVNSYFEEVGSSVGEELLKPTKIYAKEIVALLHSGIDVRALVNVTSDGLLNLLRLHNEVGYEIEKLPEPQPIFRLIQEQGHIPNREMYHVYNMGVGFCVGVRKEDVDRTLQVLDANQADAEVIGFATSHSPKRVYVRPARLVGEGETFTDL